MKKINIFMAMGLVLVMLLGACTSTSVQSDYSSSNTQNTASTQQSSQGRAVFAIKDAAADMGAVTSVKVTVDSVKVHSETEGWVTVSSSQKNYDLLQLKAQGKQELLADVQLKDGTYDQLRLDISNVVVTDADGMHEAKLPSGELKINGNLVVEGNTTSTVTFDFIADESLHVTGNGKYIMAPVVQVETRSDADVQIGSGNKVEIKGGNVKTNVKVGMDLDGNVGVNVKVPSNANITIDSSGMVKIGSGNAKGSANAGIGIGASA